MLALCVFAPTRTWAWPPGAEARVSLDLKDTGIADIVGLMAEVGSFQVVVDPEVSCVLTLKLKDVTLEAALQAALRSCRLAQEEENGILRVAPASKITEELRLRRQLAEDRRLTGPGKTILHRLSYARASELAPLLQGLLSPRGQVVFDARTNTLLITDAR